MSTVSSGFLIVRCYRFEIKAAKHVAIHFKLKTVPTGTCPSVVVLLEGRQRKKGFFVIDARSGL